MSEMAIDTAPAAERKAQLGQFFTPPAIANFMAGLFVAGKGGDASCRLLDAGAGIGSLSDAFLRRWLAGGLGCQRVEVDAFEIDRTLHPKLVDTLGQYRQYPGVSIHIHGEDFIDTASDWLSGSLFASPLPAYTHAILNPPYKKIRSDSPHRAALRRAGIETVNLYTAFVALALDLLAEHGQLVAIIPRSFCNGPYYKPFREFVLQRAALRRMHLFTSRTTAFKDDEVLQENIIILLERGGQQGRVTVSLSTDDTFGDLASHDYPFDQIILPGDPERFIHVPTSPGLGTLAQSAAVRCSLDDLGIAVSTGPVVDYRVQAHLRAMPEPGTAPLLYPAHFSGAEPAWPTAGKKPNAIARNADTEKWLYPNGFYCVVRRFSSKEERRRVVASVVDPALFGEATMLGFENHLNVFHDSKRGLPEALARGLALYLNTIAVDEQFRRFNGHTQVNATDLRTIKYPSREMLIELGNWARQRDGMNDETDRKAIDDSEGSSTGPLAGAFPELASLSDADLEWAKEQWQRGVERQLELMSAQSLTDWDRLDAMQDEDIDLGDSPEITPEMFAKAIVRSEGQPVSQSTRLKSLLDRSRESIKQGKGLPAEDFWQAVANRTPESAVHGDAQDE